MRHILIAVLVLAVASVAMAGNNTLVNAYISFDPAGDPDVNTIEGVAFTTVSAYFCLGCLDGGMTTVSVMFNDVLVECPGVMATKAFVNLLPGNLGIGDAFVGGITLASTECMTMDPVIVGRVDMFYLGGACCVKILDHTEFPRWVVDCQDPGQVDLYCLEGYGSVSGGVCPDPETCLCDSPIEDATWGAIKSLYN